MENMTKISTNNYIVQYLYGEFSPAASIECMESIMQDYELMEEFEALAEVKEFIEKNTFFSPDKASVDKILTEAYS